MTTISEPLVYTVGQVVDTRLTPNSNAITRATFDLNDSTYVTFFYQNRIPYWPVLVSIGTEKITLDARLGNDVVTFRKGLTVTFNAQGANLYTVTVDGTIVDSGQRYKLVGKSLGVFERGAGIRARLAAKAKGPS